MFVPFSISIENIIFHISSYSILLSSGFQAVRLSGNFKCLCAVAKYTFKSSGIYMVIHCNLARLRFLDGSVGVFVGITDMGRATFTWGPLLVKILVEKRR